MAAPRRPPDVRSAHPRAFQGAPARRGVALFTPYSPLQRHIR